MMRDTSDPLSAALESLHLRVRRVCRLDLAQPGGVRLPADDSWLHVVKSGGCQIAVEPAGEAATLEPGDLVLLRAGTAHRIRDHMGDAMSIAHNARLPESSRSPDRQPTGQCDSDTIVVSACLDVDALFHHPLHAVWPTWIRDRHNDDDWIYATFLRSVDDTERDSGSPQPGSQTILSSLVRLLVIRTVQRHVLRSRDELRGSLKALLAPDIGPALALMHSHPGRPWTISSLAETVAMSRTAFSSRFTEEVGMPPGQYLLECRMHEASALLAEGRLSMDEIAMRTGYESASAFSKAFKRWAGRVPSDYRRAMNDVG
jgi:AraC-like DNA-binding protein